MTTTTRSAVKASGLRKAFGATVVLDGIDLDIAAGTVFGLLGANGRLTFARRRGTTPSEGAWAPRDEGGPHDDTCQPHRPDARLRPCVTG
jgi:hypothetical protein